MALLILKLFVLTSAALVLMFAILSFSFSYDQHISQSEIQTLIDHKILSRTDVSSNGPNLCDCESLPRNSIGNVIVQKTQSQRNRSSFKGQTTSPDLLMTWIGMLNDASYIAPFLRSFRVHNQFATVVVIVPKTLPDKEMKQLRGLMSPEMQFRIEVRAHAHNDMDWGVVYERHNHFRNFLKESGESWNRVIVSDAGDVIFQFDPFAKCGFVDYPCTVSFSEEDSRFLYSDDSAVNERQCLGDDFFNKVLSPKVMVNAGFLWGTATNVRKFYDVWVFALLRSQRCPGMDQVQLNAIIRNGTFEKSYPECRILLETDADRTCLQVLGIPYHIFKADPSQYSHSREPFMILGKPGNDSSVVAAVHMWNDHPAHEAHVRTKYN
jgi:hypothetical protein